MRVPPQNKLFRLVVMPTCQGISSLFVLSPNIIFPLRSVGIFLFFNNCKQLIQRPRLVCLVISYSRGRTLRLIIESILNAYYQTESLGSSKLDLVKLIIFLIRPHFGLGEEGRAFEDMIL